MTNKSTAKKETRKSGPKRSDRFDAARGASSKATLAQEICAQLEIHAELEEEIGSGTGDELQRRVS